VRRLRILAAGAAALALAGCAVGPRYVSPEPRAPGQGAFLGAASPAVSPAPPPGDWWRLYQDPALDGLIAEALKANTDLRQAAAHLAQARAALRETRSSLTPQTTLSGSVSRGRDSAAALGLGARQPDRTTFDAGLDVSYELDLFGRLRRGIEASRADLGAVQAAYDLARVTVVADTTRAYADACAYGQQLDVARRALELQQQSYDLTQGLLKAGRGTALDVARAGALLDQTRAQIPQLQAQRKGALYRLAVLTGRPPAEVSPAAEACRTPPVLRQPIPVGDGAALLARRPDVREAERTLAASTARIGVATADLYPSVTLGASAGSTAASFGGLGRSNAFRFSVGPLIQWTFPNILAAKARIAQARAAAAADLAAFDGTWLTALQETETALAAYAGQLDRVSALTGARDQAATASRLAHARFRSGLVSFIDVLDADRTLADADTALAQAQAQLSADQIALFLALGGGWQGAGSQTSTG
jgi:NodT family efflux transporter outer membrane factor (OMF) lipoprotein